MGAKERKRPLPRPSHITLCLALILVGCTGGGHFERDVEALGTTASIELHTITGSAAATTFDDVDAAFRRAERSLTLRPESELAILNREAVVAPYGVQDTDLYRCMLIAIEWARATSGAYDPTLGPLRELWGLHGGAARTPRDDQIAAALPRTGWKHVTLYPEAQAVRLGVDGMQADLHGIVQGYALDMAARSFARSGVRGALLGLGRVQYAWRGPPARDGWRVAIVDPADPSRGLGHVTVEHRGIGFAGSLAPLLDPEAPAWSEALDAETGRPPDTDVLAAVAIADTGAAASTVSHALYVMGSVRAGALLERTQRVEAILLVRGAQEVSLIASASLAGRLEVDPDLLERVGGRVRHLLPPATFP
jgi:thiamine biosynthesis lipoprotein